MYQIVLERRNKHTNKCTIGSGADLIDVRFSFALARIVLVAARRCLQVEESNVNAGDRIGEIGDRD